MMGSKTFELPDNYDDLDDEMKAKAEDDVYHRQLIWKWGYILKDLKDSGRI